MRALCCGRTCTNHCNPLYGVVETMPGRIVLVRGSEHRLLSNTAQRQRAQHPHGQGGLPEHDERRDKVAQVGLSRQPEDLQQGSLVPAACFISCEAAALRAINNRGRRWRKPARSSVILSCNGDRGCGSDTHSLFDTVSLKLEQL